MNTKRFSIYAPYVKKLEVFGDKDEEYLVSDWDRLLSPLNQYTLLPNLVTLNLQSGCTNHHPVVPQFGILFASASLQELLFTSQPFDNPPETPQSTVKDLIRHIDKQSPRLHKLAIFAESDDVYTQEDGPFEFLHVAPGQSLDRLPAYMTEIRDLCCNLIFLAGKGMGVLGELLHLEYLTIHSETYDAEYSLMTMLPDDSFPSLKCLNLCSSLEEDFVTVFKIRPLFSRITTLNIRSQENSFNVPASPLTFHGLFPFLRNVSCLQNLNIDFDPSRADTLLSRWQLSTVSDSIAHLPLKSLAVYPWTFDLNDLAGLGTGTTWAQLTYLELPRNYASTSVLSIYSQLPSLQHLVITLSLQLDFGNSYPSQKSDHLPFHTLEASEHSWKCIKDLTARDCPFLHGPVLITCSHSHRIDNLDKIARYAICCLL